MEKRVLVVHGSRFGQSEKIARRMAEQLTGAGIDCEIRALSRGIEIDEKRYAGLLIVTSVRYGYFDKNLYRLISAHRSWIESVPALLVTVSLTARNAEKRDPTIHSYTVKLLEKSAWPGDVEVVAGALEYPRYKIWDRLAIQLIMHITDGPTDPQVHIEYTDWDQVGAAAQRFAGAIASL